jgi:hypothetical protein
MGKKILERREQAFDRRFIQGKRNVIKKGNPHYGLAVQIVRRCRAAMASARLISGELNVL